MKKILCIILSAMIILSLAACMGKKPPLDITDATDSEKTVTATVFFPDDEAMYLNGEEREIASGSTLDMARAVIDEILKGPSIEGLNDAIHGDVKVLGVTLDDEGLCTVDLSKEFELYNTGGSAMESMAIYSIVNSLCSLEGIDRVKIDIEGDKGAEYGGHFLLDEPFEEDTNFYRVKN